jgi:hypothetical protein
LKAAWFGILYLSGVAGLILSTSFFEAEECKLYARHGYIAAANALDCNSLVLGTLTYHETSNGFFVAFLSGPIVIGILAVLSNMRIRKENAVSFPFYLTWLLALVASIPLAFYFGVVGFIANQYYVETKCPANAEEIGLDCSFVLSKYNLTQMENVANTAASAVILLTALVYLKKTYNRVGSLEVDHGKA